jgi:hypothetical protein
MGLREVVSTKMQTGISFAAKNSPHDIHLDDSITTIRVQTLAINTDHAWDAVPNQSPWYCDPSENVRQALAQPFTYGKW